MAALESSSVSPRQRVVIGTRKSQLAMWQAEFVCAELQRLHPDQEFVVQGLSTIGDQDQNTPLSQFTIKGVFTKELDVAQLGGHVDLVVHCVKDLPTVLVEGLTIGAVLERGDTADGVIMHPKHKDLTLADLPAGSVIGTSALRRQALLHHRFPQLECKEIRGNVNTRLQKLADGHYDAIILACTGLERLGMQDRVSERLETLQYGTAVGQGALAITCREDDQESLGLVADLQHMPTVLAVEAERALLRTLEGGCKVPMAVIAQLLPSDKANPSDSPISLSLSATVYSADGQQRVEDLDSVVLERTAKTKASDISAKDLKSAQDLGVRLANRLIKEGAKEILEAIKAGDHLGHRAPEPRPTQEE